jgi:uncharacterized membrane protein YhaH (DUF805 family)
VRPADVFLSFEGRLDRRRWIAAASIFVGAIALTYLATWLLDRRGLIAAAPRDMARTFVQAFVLVPWLAVDWKRFQDLDRSGRLALVCPGLFLASLAWDLLGARAGAPVRETVATGLAWSQLFVALWLAPVFLLMAGTDGPNRFGPDPRTLP